MFLSSQKWEIALCPFVELLILFGCVLYIRHKQIRGFYSVDDENSLQETLRRALGEFEKGKDRGSRAGAKSLQSLQTLRVQVPPGV